MVRRVDDAELSRILRRLRHGAGFAALRALARRRDRLSTTADLATDAHYSREAVEQTLRQAWGAHLVYEHVMPGTGGQRTPERGWALTISGLAFVRAGERGDAPGRPVRSEGVGNAMGIGKDTETPYFRR